MRLLDTEIGVLFFIKHFQGQSRIFRKMQSSEIDAIMKSLPLHVISGLGEKKKRNNFGHDYLELLM